MKRLDNILKICGIVLLITLTFKVFTFENSGRYVFRGEKHSDTLDSKTGIVTVFNKSKTSLHKIYQVNPMKGEIRYFLDEKWDDWMKLKNREIGQ
jgi:hypothetical protein